MRRIVVLMIVVCLGATAGLAQKFVIHGTVTDSAANPLPSATVMLMQKSDSSLVGFSVSGAGGLFELRNVSRGNYFVKVTYAGLTPLSKEVTFPATGEQVTLGELRMVPFTTVLDGVTIKGETAPVTVKRDTIEYNATAFAVKPNANVEELLKKMPGIDVETDGTVKAQGEEVRRVMVDGREFFGRDPKLATRNLPADAVNKVQVFDKKSDQAVFSGIDDGQREKTINLELKEEKRKGAFGNMMAGAGNNDRFQSKLSINKFRKAEQMSVLGMANNVNEQGFSFDDYFNFSGASSQVGGGGGGRLNVQIGGDNNTVPLNTGGRQNGIVTNYAGGVNFNKDFNKKTILTSNYFYSRLDQDVTKTTDRVNFLPDNRSYNFNEQSKQRSISDTHRGNLSLDYRIDSANSIKWAANASYGTTQQNIVSQSQTFNLNNQLQNQSARSTFSQGTAANLNTSLLFRHRFKKKGRTFSSNFGFVHGDTKSNGDLNSLNEFFTEPLPEQRLLQTNTQSNVNTTYSATLSYTEPLGNRKYLEVNYAVRTNQNDVSRNVLDVPTQTQNELLSNTFGSDYLYQRPGLNFRVNRNKLNLALGATYQVTNLSGTTNQAVNSVPTRTPVNRTFENLLPSARFNYDFSSNKHLRFDYETSMQEPSIQQLQPVINNTDPLNVSAGNPNLKPAYLHTGIVNYTGFDPARMTNFFAFVTVNYMKNAMTYAQSVDPATLIRTSRPENTDYSLTVSSNVSFGLRFKELNSRLNLGPTARFDQSINLLNDRASKITQRNLGGRIRYNFALKEILILDLSANFSRQTTEYETGNQQGQEFFNKTYSAEVSLRFLKHYNFNPSFEYLVYDSRSTNFNQTIPLLGISVSRFVLKNNVGEIKFSVNNMLDRNLGVQQTANSNFLQREVTNSLGRYFMLSFTYLLNKQLNPMGGGGGRRAMRMIINN